MAFKSFAQYQEDKQGEFFVLPNNGDYADVVFLYQNMNQVLVADVHYISSPGYKGYVHCCENGCPACNYITSRGNRGLRLDHKIFIPLYNIQKNKIEFWDRSTFFESVLQTQVFAKYPNPSEVVFRITRNGAAGDRDTKYDITPINRNPLSYEQILSTFNITFPEAYSAVCKEMSVGDMSAALSAANAPSDLPDYGYTPVPRGAAADASPAPEINVPVPDYGIQADTVPPVLADYTIPEAAPAVDLSPLDATNEVPDEIQEASDVADDSGDLLSDVSDVDNVKF